MRADQLLVERGLAVSRSQAVRLIASGVRWQDGATWRQVAKNKDDIPSDAPLELLDDAEARYVSRGGLKLEGALRVTGLDVSGQWCLDVGQSTGGFTDCLLRHGAARVVGIDVGQAQLHPRMREDARVLCVESVNARALDASEFIAECQQWAGAEAEFDGYFSVLVADLSFISLTLVLPAVVPLLAPGGQLLVLVKPQFELQPGQVGKGGIVRDAALYGVVEQRLRDCCAALGLEVTAWFDSPIEGGDGNREFFLAARRGP